jgi:hypothetical protein
MGRGEAYWRKGVSDEQKLDEQQQFYELTKYLLTKYKGTGKTFILQHWEGDWLIRGSFNRKIDPTPEAISGMIKWLNARQAGVNQAREEIGTEGVWVYHAAEVNRVVDSMKNGKPNMVNKVLPHTKLDLVSYSAWDSAKAYPEDPQVFKKALDFIAANMPDSSTFGNLNVYVGEFGIPENKFPTEQIRKVIHNTVTTALEWGCPYIIYWQLYCNELEDGKEKTPVKSNDAVRGFWLIRPDGTKAWTWDYFYGLLNSADQKKDQQPPGLVYLNQAPAGHDFDAFLQESTVQSELFRRRLLAGSDPDFVNANLIAKAILKFQQQAPRYLKRNRNIESFNLSKNMIIEAISGREHIPSHIAYGRFQGKWYGLWDKMSVDHHWSEIVEPENPQRVSIKGEKPVWIRSYQYCWVGDGYGLNMIATADPDSKTSDFLLGYVIHVENGDIEKPTKRRPHVGLFVNEGKLIWITAGEVFLEESFKVSPGVEAYAITGFFYKVSDGILQTTQCFQAIYTREPENRPKWYSFPLKLQVSH